MICVKYLVHLRFLINPMCGFFPKSVLGTLKNADVADSREKVCVFLRSSASSQGENGTCTLG